MGQNHLWKCFDFDGNIRFSVSGDTLQAFGDDIFGVRNQNQFYFFYQDPFQPVFQSPECHWFKIIPGWIGSQRQDGKFRVFQIRQGVLQPLSGIYRAVQAWHGQLLIQTDLKVFFKPGDPGEVVADSFCLKHDRLFLYRSDGIVRVDSGRSPVFFPGFKKNGSWNPGYTYFLNDTIWHPTESPGAEFVAAPNQFWWNDTMVLDSSVLGVFGQSRNQKRFRLGDSAVCLSSRMLYLRKKKQFLLLFADGRKQKIPKIQEWVRITDTLIGIRTAIRWELIGFSGNRNPVNKTVSKLGELSEGLIRVKAGKRYGYIDVQGFIRISCRYDSLSSFSNGLSAALIGNQWGFLDKDERIRIQPHYDEVHPFSGTLTRVRKGGKYGLISQKGDFSIEPQWEWLQPVSQSQWKFRKSGWCGWLDSTGKILVPNRYSDIIEAWSGRLKVRRESKFGLFTREGNQILPISFIELTEEAQSRSIIVR